MLILPMANQGHSSLALRNVNHLKLQTKALKREELCISFSNLTVFISFLDTFAMEVESEETYLLRVVNAALNDGLFFAIAGHNMTV